MKKLLLLLLTTLSFAQTQNYLLSNQNILNPERGFYHNVSTDLIATTYPLLNQATLVGYRNTEKISTIQRLFYLNQFTSSLISPSYLANLQTDLNTIRNAGLKVIVRFAYSKSKTATPIDVPKALMLQHIAQVGTILTANKDVIASYQYGWIGAWGETYYSSQVAEFGTGDYTLYSNLQYTNRKEILDAMLASVPSEIPIQVRYIYHKQRMYASGNNRIGFYNDAFLNQWGDSGTFLVSGANGSPTLSDSNYLTLETVNSPMSGETDGVNSPRTDCANAQFELNLYNWSLLNKDYLTANITNWQTNGCYPDIENDLGYRFELFNSTYNNLGNTLQISINGINLGYSAPFKDRSVYFVLKETTTGLIYPINTNLNAKTWYSNFNINQSISLVGIPSGTYNTYLWLPDGSLTNNPNYAIQMANIGMWDATTGYNNLNQVVVVNSGCATTTWNGIAWSNGNPNVNTTAIINAPYTVNGIAPTVNFDCCDLIVNSSLQINNNRFVTYQGSLSGSGSVVVKNNGKLIPALDTSTCSMNVTVERTTPTLKKFDYVFWSSPVTNQLIGGSLANWNSDRTFTFNGAYFIDQETNYQGTFISNIQDGQDDADPSPWILANFGNSFQSGLGYPSMIISGIFPRTETVSFTGLLNTGIISTPLILSGNPTVQVYNPNIVGNPFSASIFLDTFIIDNLPNISGTVSFWTHTNTLSSSYSGLEQLNYSVGDYAEYNLSGGIASSFGGAIPNGFLPSCQGFYINAETNSNLLFKPSYMASGYLNNGFFRVSPYTQYRINLYDANVAINPLSKQILINYNSDTSLDYDKGWDSKLSILNEPLKLYSSEAYDIEARGDFDVDDVVRIGYKTAIESDFIISMQDLSVIENVYLYDLELGVEHNLTAPYTFHSLVGEFNNRFEIHYNSLLSVKSDKKITFKVIPNPTNNICTIFFDNSKLSNTFVTEISGRVVDVKLQSFKDRIVVNLESVSIGTYLVNIDGNIIKVVKK